MTYETLNPPPGRTGGLEPPTLKHEDFAEDLAKYNLTPEQEREILEILWDVVRTIVDAGFGLDSASMVIPSLLESAFPESADGVQQNEQANDNTERKQP